VCIRLPERAHRKTHVLVVDAEPGVLMQISHRYVNSVALINAAFSFNLESNGKTFKEARVVFGLPGALPAAPRSVQRRAQRRVSTCVADDTITLSNGSCANCYA